MPSCGGFPCFNLAFLPSPGVGSVVVSQLTSDDREQQVRRAGEATEPQVLEPYIES